MNCFSSIGENISAKFHLKQIVKFSSMKISRYMVYIQLVLCKS